jgi:hypothetical protein
LCAGIVIRDFDNSCHVTSLAENTSANFFWAFIVNHYLSLGLVRLLCLSLEKPVLNHESTLVEFVDIGWILLAELLANLHQMNVKFTKLVLEAFRPQVGLSLPSEHGTMKI